MKDNDTLVLVLKKKWFDMIASGIKKEEYREIKDYWIRRLILKEYTDEAMKSTPLNEMIKQFKYVRFRLGYASNAPEMKFELKSISIGIGKKEWGALDKEVFILSLGERLL